MASPSAQPTATPTTGATAELLGQIARRYGTPCYAYDVNRIRQQAERLRNTFPSRIELYYSMKANSSLGIGQVVQQCGLGADIASAGELATAIKAGFAPERIFVAGPHKSTEVLEWLLLHPQAIVSVDSPYELALLVKRRLPCHAVLRLRPDFPSNAVVGAGAGTRFGFLLDQLADCRPLIDSGTLDVFGFHVFAGSQVLDSDAAVAHLQASFELANRASELLGIEPRFLNLGGGFGIPYAADEAEMDLERVSQAVRAMLEDRPETRIAFELGRYLVAPAGWYLTRVVGLQTQGDRPAVIVDGGIHQRADLCGLCLRTKAAPPLVLRAAGADRVGWAKLTDSPGFADVRNPSDVAMENRPMPTDVWGCLSLPDDILAEACELPPLQPGDVLAFGNSGAYGLWASAANFHGFPLPAEVAFDQTQTYLLRSRRAPPSILEHQQLIDESD